MIQIILTSHGPMAEAMISSAAMLYGEKDNVTALSLGEDDNIEEFHARMERDRSFYAIYQEGHRVIQQ